MSQALHYLLHFPFVAVAGSLFYCAAASAAVLRGDEAARRLGVALLVEYLLVDFVNNYARMGDLQLGVFVLDAVLLGVIVWLAIAYFRLWLIAAASFQLVAVCAHLAKALDPSIGGRLYITATNACSYGVVCALIAGLVQHWRSQGLHASRRG